MLRRLFLTLAAAALAACCCLAQTPDVDPAEPADSIHILSVINAPGSSIRVDMPPLLAQRLTFGSASLIDERASESQRHASGRQVGYRVQVFSDNNPRTAKSNAEYRKRTIEQRLPSMRAYLKFAPPYWRVQVGDFRTEGEAHAAQQQLEAAFPAYASDMKVIKERINISN